MNLAAILVFLQKYWPAIAPVIYEAIVRLWPTRKNWSLLDLIFKVIGIVIPNIKKSTNMNNVNIYSRHTIKPYLIGLILLFLSCGVFAQVDSIFITSNGLVRIVYQGNASARFDANDLSFNYNWNNTLIMWYNPQKNVVFQFNNLSTKCIVNNVGTVTNYLPVRCDSLYAYLQRNLYTNAKHYAKKGAASTPYTASYYLQKVGNDFQWGNQTIANTTWRVGTQSITGTVASQLSVQSTNGGFNDMSFLSTKNSQQTLLHFNVDSALNYDKNYHGSFKTRTLVDKGYVDSVRGVDRLNDSTILTAHVKLDSTQIKAGGNGILIPAPPAGFFIHVISGFIIYHFRTAVYAQVSGSIQVSYSTSTANSFTAGSLAMGGGSLTLNHNINAFAYTLPASTPVQNNIEALAVYWNINGAFTLGNGYLTISVFYRVEKYL